MLMRPFSFTVHADPAREPEEVMRFVVEEALGDRFRPLFAHEKPADPADFERFDEGLQATVAGEDAPRPGTDGTRESGDAVLSYLYGAWSLDADGEGVPVARYRLPALQWRDGKYGLHWEGLEPAVGVELVLNRVWKNPYFYVTIAAGHGVWGDRHRWIDAMHSICRTDSGSGPAWPEAAGLLPELESAAERMKELEERRFDLDAARRGIWDAVLKVYRRFDHEAGGITVSPSFPDLRGAPADIQVHRPAAVPGKPPHIPDIEWHLSAWVERLHWSEEGADPRRAVDYWSRIGDEEGLRRVLRRAKMGMKGAWPALVEILTRRPEQPWILEELLGFTADINWPGAVEAWTHLVKVVGSRGLPLLRARLRAAEESGDEDAAEDLRDMIGQIEEGGSDPSRA